MACVPAADHAARATPALGTPLILLPTELNLPHRPRSPMADVARLSSAHITRLPPRVALYLQASIIVAFLAASSAPTPLYAVYQAKWGFTPITITTVFGIYALAVLAALLTVG